MKSRKQRILPRPTMSQTRIVRVPADKVGLFRFILEAHDHVALFTVLDRHVALIKILFSPHEARAVEAMLQSMRSVLDVTDVPLPEGLSKGLCPSCSS